MAHECPECGQQCYCGGDIDDCCFSGTDEEDACTHCPIDGEPADDFDDGYDEEPAALRRAIRLYWQLVPLTLMYVEVYLCECVYNALWWQAKRANSWSVSVHRRAREVRAKIAA